MEEERKELERIEHENRSWESKFARRMKIWETIAFEINSTSGKKHDYWCRVMDLFHAKYE